jgi:hypothetical protein
MEKGKPPLEDTGVEGTSEPTVTDKEFPELYANGYTAKTQNTIGRKKTVWTIQGKDFCGLNYDRDHRARRNVSGEYWK